MRHKRNIFSWIAIFVIALVAYDMYSGGKKKDYPFSVFLEDVELGRVLSVEMSEGILEADLITGQKIQVYTTHYPEMIDLLRASHVSITVRPPDVWFATIISLLISWLPFFVIILVWVFFVRQMQGGDKGGGAMGFGRSRAKLHSENDVKVTLDDVAGIDEAKEELEEIIDFLKDTDRFRVLGGKVPRGCLLIGNPGTGKTLLARAIAGEAKVPFFSISGSDFVEMFVGVGASRVRNLFEQSKKTAPCIIFIDEIDAVGRHRGAGLGGGNDEREQTLNQLLVEMDGFEENSGIIVIAATNRPDVLDPALLRPGRFDRQVVVPLPDIGGRTKILNVHMKPLPLALDVDVEVLARGTPGFTGADLANTVNEAALLAARLSKKKVTMHDFEVAKDKVMMGSERRSMVIGEEEKRLTAYHEAGHAIVSIHCEFSDPIHKATIIPRGRALGMVMRLPEKDRLSLTLGKAKADIAVAMGGRIAEEMIFGSEHVTSGASSDIKMATDMARNMVTEWGMSPSVGPVNHSMDQGAIFLGKSMSSNSDNISNETANLIDQEIKRIINVEYRRAEDILITYRDQLHCLAEALLRHETLSGKEIHATLRGESLNISGTSSSSPRMSVPVFSDLSPTGDTTDEEVRDGVVQDDGAHHDSSDSRVPENKECTTDDTDQASSKTRKGTKETHQPV